MIAKNYKSSARNSRIGRVYVSIKTQLSQNSCPNCWGTQEYDAVQLKAKEIKAPKKYSSAVPLIQQLVKNFVQTSKSPCTVC